MKFLNRITYCFSKLRKKDLIDELKSLNQSIFPIIHELNFIIPFLVSNLTKIFHQ